MEIEYYTDTLEITKNNYKENKDYEEDEDEDEDETSITENQNSSDSETQNDDKDDSEEESKTDEENYNINNTDKKKYLPKTINNSFYKKEEIIVQSRSSSLLNTSPSPSPLPPPLSTPSSSSSFSSSSPQKQKPNILNNNNNNNNIKVKDYKNEKKNKKKIIIYLFLIVLIAIVFNDKYPLLKDNKNKASSYVADKDFKDLINKFNYPDEFQYFGNSMKSQILSNSANIQNDKNYKRPISIHISTDDYDKTINFLLNLFTTNNSNNNNNNNINNSSSIIQFSKFSNNQIIDKIKKQSLNNKNSIYIFKINEENDNKNIEKELGFLEKILEGGHHQIPNLSMNNLFLLISNVGQKNIKDQNLSYEGKLELIISESKKIFNHSFIHRIRDTLVL
ncbi:hypothetical protein ACTFIW_004475 [Dictyostelium discoideum]